MKKKSLSVKKIIRNKNINFLNDQKIFKIFSQFKKSLVSKGSYAVAVSGGPDSLALAFFAKCFSIINKNDIKFYIIDHKLREESSKEAKLVKSKLSKFSINCKILVWYGKKPKSNIQAEARKKRYSLLLSQCKKDKIKNLLLGHHADDLYENFLIRLLRGSGLKGITSFGEISEYHKSDIKIIRPLINLNKIDLIYISKKIFNFFISDPSNLNEDFKRIRIRNLLKTLEKEGLDKKKLALTIKNLKDSNDTLNFYLKKNLFENSYHLKEVNNFILNKDFFNQPNEIIFRSLSVILRDINKRYYPPRGKKIENLIRKLKFNINGKFTLGGCFIEKINQTVVVSSEKQSN